MAVAKHDPFLAGQPVQANRTARVDLVGRNTDLGAEADPKPSAKRVDALTITELESTSRKKRRAFV